MERPKNVYEQWTNISDETVSEWLQPENLEKRNKKTFEGFELVESIDGRLDANVEITLVKINKEPQYPQHIHKESDAYFIVISGEAIFITGDERKEVKAGDRVEVPRGMPHGFELKGKEALEFISLQSPPILNTETGENDFHLVDNI